MDWGQQCVEHVFFAPSWAKALAPVVASAITAAVVYWMTTRKESNKKRDQQDRASTIEPHLYQLLRELADDAKSVTNITDFVDLDVVSKAIVDFAEFGRTEVHQFTDFKVFVDYLKLLRVAYYARGATEALLKTPHIYKLPERHELSKERGKVIADTVTSKLDRYDTSRLVPRYHLKLIE